MITPGEISVGMAITPFEIIREKENNSISRQSESCLEGLKGVPMVVKAVKLPYIIIRSGEVVLIIDTRKMSLMSVSQEYLDAFSLSNCITPETDK